MDHGILQFLKNKMVLFGFLFNDQAIIYHQQSPLCTWQCHCRRSQSSPTHQTPAMCSGHWHFDPVYASQHLLGWSTPSLSCCVLHEAWRKAGEMPPCSTCWYLKEKKKTFSIQSVPRIRHHKFWHFICSTCSIISWKLQAFTSVEDMDILQCSNCTAASTD